MKPQHRRIIIRDAASLLAIPAVLSKRGLYQILSVVGRVARNDCSNRLKGAVTPSPRIAPPTNSVMRRV